MTTFAYIICAACCWQELPPIPAPNGSAEYLQNSNSRPDFDKIIRSRTRRPEDLPRVAPYLNSKDESERCGAIVSSFWLGAAEDSIRKFLQDKDATIRSYLAESIAERGDLAHLVIPLFRDDVPEVRRRTAVAMLEHGRTAPQELLFLLSDSDARVRIDVASAMLERDEPPAKFRWLLSDRSPIVRSEGIKVLAKAGLSLENIRPLLKDPSSTVRGSAATALIFAADVPQPNAIATLVELDGENDIQVLDSIGPKTRVALAPMAVDWLTSDDEKLTSKARHILCSPGPIPAVSVMRLREVCLHATPQAQVNALAVLRDNNLPCPEALAVARQLLFEPEMILDAIAIVRDHKLTQLLPQLRGLYKSDAWKVRVRAASAVAILDRQDTECVKILAAAYEETTSDRTYSVLGGLSNCGDRALAAGDILLKGLAPTHSQRDEPNDWSIVFREAAPSYSVLSELSHPVKLIDDWLQQADLTEGQLRALLEYADRKNLTLLTSTDTLLKLVGKYPDSQLMRPAFHLISRRPQTTAEQIGQFANSSDADLVFWVVKRLQECPGDRVRIRQVLKQLTRHEAMGIRVAACHGLMKMGGDPDYIRGVVNELMVPQARGPRPKTQTISLGAYELDMDRDYSSLVVEVPRYGPDLTDTYVFGHAGIFDLIDFAKLDKRKIAKQLASRLPEADWEFPVASYLSGLGEPGRAELLKGLESSDTTTKAACATQLGYSQVEEAIPQLVQLATYFRSPRYRGTTVDLEIRQAGIKALLHIKRYPDAEMLVPKLIDLVQLEESLEDMCALLGKLGPTARPATRILGRLAAKHSHYASFDAIRALAKIDPRKAVLPIKLRLKQTVLDQPNGELFDVIVELGAHAKPLIPYLKSIVESEQLNHYYRRVHAAYALAQLEPEEPKWIEYLRARDWPDARERLADLKALPADK